MVNKALRRCLSSKDWRVIEQQRGGITQVKAADCKSSRGVQVNQEGRPLLVRCSYKDEDLRPRLD